MARNARAGSTRHAPGTTSSWRRRSHTYFDYYQSQNTAGEPLAIGGFLPLETVYAFEPVPPELDPQYRAHILGGQGQIWTEYMAGPKQVEYMAFPRLTALAEVLWTQPERKDYRDFLGRLAVHLERLDCARRGV